MEDQNGKLSVVVSTEKAKDKKCWRINREMLPYKLHFLLFVGGAGLVFPFQSAFGITVLGFTAANIAICYTALQITIMVLKPGIGYIADYTNRLKVVMTVLALLQLTFCFFMIIIPNTSMPGIQKEEVPVTLPNETRCQLCLYPKTIEFSVTKRYLDENEFKELSSCLKNNRTENILINCSTEYFKSLNFTYDNLEIKQTTCKSAHSNAFLSENKTALVDLYASENWIDILYIKNSSNSLVCLLPQEIKLNLNTSSGDLNQYCHDLSSKVDLELQKLFVESNFTTLYCDDLNKNTPPSQRKDEHQVGMENFKTYQFWAFALCLVLSCTFGSSQFTMSDTACYESIQGNDYGQQRVWGAVSWGLMAPFAGYLNDYTESYMAAWCIYACFTAFQIWNFSKMNLVKPDFSQNMLKDIKSIFNSLEFLCFIIGVLLNGMFTAVIWYYLTWFIVSIGGNKLVIGLAHTFQCFLGEVPAMYFSGWLIRKLGHFNLVSLALIGHGIRFFFYSYLHNPWWILPIESLHGLTFGSFYAAMTSYGKLNSKPGTEATTQSILCTTFEALGCGLGCLITGVCLEYYGGHTTFFYASFLCVLATMINVFFTIILKCRKGIHVVTNSSKSTERY